MISPKPWKERETAFELLLCGWNETNEIFSERTEAETLANKIGIFIKEKWY